MLLFNNSSAFKYSIPRILFGLAASWHILSAIPGKCFCIAIFCAIGYEIPDCTNWLTEELNWLPPLSRISAACFNTVILLHSLPKHILSTKPRLSRSAVPPRAKSPALETA